MDWYVLGGSIGLGIAYLFWQLNRYKWKYKKPDSIKHYEDVRDKLTTREQEEPQEEESGGGGGLGNLIGGFIVVIIGVNLIPTMASQVVAAQAGNVTGAASTILGLTSTLFVLGITAAAVSMVVFAYRWWR